MKQNVVKQYLEVEVRNQGLIGGEWIQVSWGRRTQFSLKVKVPRFHLRWENPAHTKGESTKVSPKMGEPCSH
jgi:hypothetical protein